MFFICNNSLLFDPEAHAISLVGQPETALTLSAPAVRLLQEFIRHKGHDLSREELITRVWEEYGFTPSGNNLNKAVSELRKTFQFLGEHHDYIVTIPRYGFRFVADVICQPAQAAEQQSQPSVAPPEKKRQRISLNWAVAAAVLLAAAAGLGLMFKQHRKIVVPMTPTPVAQKIAGCSIWLINDHGQPLVVAKLATLLEANNVACERETYNIYYFSARFNLAAADEVFIGACPVSKTSLCKTIRYKSGAEK